VIVFDDADLEQVVAGLRTFGYYNAGQDCTAACRVYAGPKIYEKLVADLSSAVSTIRVGEQHMDGVEMGPLISERQRSRVASFVERAASQRHIEVTAGGKAGASRGFFYEPTVIAGALQTDEIVRREVFGPVVSVTRLRRPGPGVGGAPRLRLRAREFRVDGRCEPRVQGGRRAALRLHVDQHSFHARERNAPWRHEALWVWQRHVGLRARGLHLCAPRDGEVRVAHLLNGSQRSGKLPRAACDRCFFHAFQPFPFLAGLLVP
jgi:hypothetical protein